MHSSTKPAGKRSRHQRNKRLVARKIAEGEVACRAMQEEIECLRHEMERQREQSKEGGAIKDVSAHVCQCEALRQTLSENEHQQQILEGELRQKNSKLEESVCERGRLTKEIDGLRQELVRERGNCQELNDATESQFEALRKQIAEREEQQKTLQEELRQRNTQCDTMAQTINELQKSSEQKVCDQKSQCDSLKHKVAELEKHLQEKTSILESTLSEAETLRKEVFQNNEDSKDRAALQKKIDALDEELMKVCLEKSHVQAELTKAQGEVDMYQTALRAMKIAGAQNQHDMVEANGRVDIEDGSPSAGSISPPSEAGHISTQSVTDSKGWVWSPSKNMAIRLCSENGADFLHIKNLKESAIAATVVFDGDHKGLPVRYGSGTMVRPKKVAKLEICKWVETKTWYKAVRVILVRSDSETVSLAYNSVTGTVEVSVKERMESSGRCPSSPSTLTQSVTESSPGRRNAVRSCRRP